MIQRSDKRTQDWGCEGEWVLHREMERKIRIGAEIIGRPTDVVAKLRTMGCTVTTSIEGYFIIHCNGKRLQKGSGIAGDWRWFYSDTKQTAHWIDFTK